MVYEMFTEIKNYLSKYYKSDVFVLENSDDTIETLYTPGKTNYFQRLLPFLNTARALGFSSLQIENDDVFLYRMYFSNESNCIAFSLYKVKSVSSRCRVYDMKTLNEMVVFDPRPEKPCVYASNKKHRLFPARVRDLIAVLPPLIPTVVDILTAVYPLLETRMEYMNNYKSAHCPHWTPNDLVKYSKLSLDKLKYTSISEMVKKEKLHNIKPEWINDNEPSNPDVYFVINTAFDFIEDENAKDEIVKVIFSETSLLFRGTNQTSYAVISDYYQDYVSKGIVNKYDYYNLFNAKLTESMMSCGITIKNIKRKYKTQKGLASAYIKMINDAVKDSPEAKGNKLPDNIIVPECFVPVRSKLGCKLLNSLSRNSVKNSFWYKTDERNPTCAVQVVLEEGNVAGVYVYSPDGFVKPEIKRACAGIRKKGTRKSTHVINKNLGATVPF